MNITNTLTSSIFTGPTLMWCVLMPSIHLFSLVSNILCIIVFCSKTFIHKPIAIYFICLLLSDSITLLIGYTEMIERESYMMDKAFLLCKLNGKVTHLLMDYVYPFMDSLCLEWMLYKVLWTRVSTILLAILSIQRSRTFFSLSYRETRVCAYFACIVSVLVAFGITCLEWIRFHCNTPQNPQFYIDILNAITDDSLTSNLFVNITQHSNQSADKYLCIMPMMSTNSTLNISTTQSNCTNTEIAFQFRSLIQSLLTDRSTWISDTATLVLTNVYNNLHNPLIYSNYSLLASHLQQAKSSEFLLKLFEKRKCQIPLAYSFCVKAYDFLHSVSFAFNRRTLAIFFGNALPSFIIVLANLLSIKVIFFSKSLKYLKQSTSNRRKRRLQNDLRAFLVILVESFSVILVSWGIPIFLTMYHCRTLYVVVINTCPEIQQYLPLFLFTDLFNSSTNCLLYSLSGRLFRRKLYSILKTIFTCGRGTLWHGKQSSQLLPTHPLDRQPSNDPSILTLNHFGGGLNSRSESYRRRPQRISSPISYLSISKLGPMVTPIARENSPRQPSDDGSLSIVKPSDDQVPGYGLSTNFESEDFNQQVPRKSSQSIKSFILEKVRSLSSASSTNSKNRPLPLSQCPETIKKKKSTKNGDKRYKTRNSYSHRPISTDPSLGSSTSCSGSQILDLQRHQIDSIYRLSKVILTSAEDQPTTTASLLGS